MNFLLRLLILAVCLNATTCVFAQKSIKNLSQLLKSSFTAPKNAALGGLSADQLQMLQSHFSALEETRRALSQNPSWVISSNFNKTAQRLAELDLPMPKHPAPSASVKEKEKYLRELNTLLQHEDELLGMLLHKNPRPQTPMQHFQQKPEQSFRERVLSFSDWEKLFQNNQPDFSWGTENWDRVHVSPSKMFQNPQSLLYVDPATLKQLTSNLKLSNADLYDLILQKKDLSATTKMELICAIEEAGLVLTHSFTRVYIYVFGSVPSLEYEFDNSALRIAALETYVTAVHKRLLRKLETKGRWSPKDFELFAQVSAFLEPRHARVLLEAVTYLEPSAVRWLLTNPLDNHISQHLIARAQQLRQEKDIRWPDGKIIPKEKTSIDFEYLKKQRIQSLKSYNKLLSARLNKLLKLDYNLKRAQQMLQASYFPPNVRPEDRKEYLSAKIFFSARLARLNKLINEIKIRLQETEEEIFQSSRE